MARTTIRTAGAPTSDPGGGIAARGPTRGALAAPVCSGDSHGHSGAIQPAAVEATADSWGRRRSKPLVSSGSSIAVTSSGSRASYRPEACAPNLSNAGVSRAEDETLASIGLPYWVLVKGGATVGLARGTSGLCNFGLGGAFLFVETE